MLNALNYQSDECNTTTTTTTMKTFKECMCYGFIRSSQQKQQHSNNYNNNTLSPLQSLPILSSLLSVTLCLQLLLLLLSSELGSPALAAPQGSLAVRDDDVHETKAVEPFEELIFDHEVTGQDAIEALRSLNESHMRTQMSCSSIKCSTHLNYCLGHQFINDHCWCELKHREEGLPYVPHGCYVAQKVSRPSVKSCFSFEEIKECCCAVEFIKQWRHKSGAALSFTQPKMSCALYWSAITLVLLKLYTI